MHATPPFGRVALFFMDCRLKSREGRPSAG
jgi:hypothetical protein